MRASAGDLRHEQVELGLDHVVAFADAFLRAADARRAVASRPALLKSADVPHQAFFYPITQHGSHNNSTLRYQESAAKLSSERTMGHFHKYHSATSLPPIRAGKLKALAVIGPNRLVAMPEVATMRDLGYPEMETVRS